MTKIVFHQNRYFGNNVCFENIFLKVRWKITFQLFKTMFSNSNQWFDSMNLMLFWVGCSKAFKNIKSFFKNMSKHFFFAFVQFWCFLWKFQTMFINKNNFKIIGTKDFLRKKFCYIPPTIRGITVTYHIPLRKNTCYFNYSLYTTVCSFANMKIKFMLDIQAHKNYFGVVVLIQWERNNFCSYLFWSL